MKKIQDQKDKKDAAVRVRFTPSQVDALKTAAAAAGTTVSEHIRAVVLSDDLTHRALVLQQLAEKGANNDSP